MQITVGMQSDPVVQLGPDVIVGSYRIIKEIGRGGMGTVYEAVHTVLPRRAALKVMHTELKRQPGMATRMVQEAAILEDVRHGGLVRVFECNMLDDHRPWIAMELVEGETLANRLHFAPKMPAAELAKLLSEVADVLAAVHVRGIVHRDLKPDNLLLTPTDPCFPLRLIDWGVARLGPMGRLTLDGLTPGTPIYMSPEQATGKNITPACDIYSLGVIAYEALAGHPPFDGRTLAEVVCMHLTGEPAPLREQCDAPKELCDLVHRMLEKNPSCRPGSIEVRQQARAIASEQTSAYAEFELTGLEELPTKTARARSHAARGSEHPQRRGRHRRSGGSRVRGDPDGPRRAEAALDAGDRPLDADHATAPARPGRRRDPAQATWMKAPLFCAVAPRCAAPHVLGVRSG
ncbi:MAG: serine/threonine-protein kinase [Polyangiales bacterium]